MKLSGELSAFCDRIGHRFDDPSLIVRAVTHASIVTANREDNQRLEFLGDAIFGAMRSRRHYGTTGCRLHLEVGAALGPDGRRYASDPAGGDTSAEPCAHALMGDIVSTPEREVALTVACNASNPKDFACVHIKADPFEPVHPFAVSDVQVFDFKDFLADLGRCLVHAE